MALSKKDILKVGQALASPAAAKEFLACIDARTTMSKKTQIILASALCDQLKPGYAVTEIASAILTGRTLSVKTQKKLHILMADARIGWLLINMIQATPTKPHAIL